MAIIETVSNHGDLDWSDLSQTVKSAVWGIVSYVSMPEVEEFYAASEIEETHSAFYGNANSYAVLYKHEGKYYIETVVVIPPLDKSWQVLVESLGVDCAADLVSSKVFTLCDHKVSLEYDHTGDPWLEIRLTERALPWLLQDRWYDQEVIEQVSQDYAGIESSHYSCAACLQETNELNRLWKH